MPGSADGRGGGMRGCWGGKDSHPLRGEDEGNRRKTVRGVDQEGAVSGMKHE